MGCCVSSGKSSSSAHKFDAAAAGKIFGPLTDNGSREPPSSMEEETVKEVLSETHALKPLPISPPLKNCPPEEDEAQKPVGDKVTYEIEKKLPEIPINGIAQQASEFDEISNPDKFFATANFTDTMDGGEEVHQMVLKALPTNQSIPGDVGLKRKLSPNKTLNRRSDQSPVRRNSFVGSARLVQKRDASPTMTHRGLRTEPTQKDPDENLSRRSRSPATARFDGGGSRSALGRTPSVRKSGKSSPLRTPTATTQAQATSRKVVEENNITDGNMITQIESLENPLVSLECFIFLRPILLLPLG